MATKKRKAADTKVDKNKVYSLKEASTLVKDINCTKFDSSVDIHIRLGVDPKSRPGYPWFRNASPRYW
jgi:large subunit ribosomal protein L1